MLIRNATSADIPAILAIIEEAYAPYIVRIGKKPGPMLEDYAALIERRVVSVLEDAVGIAGLVVLLLQDGKAMLDNVAVAGRVRGQGVGSRLIGHAERRAAEQGFTEIILYTHVMMTENRAIYPHLGYRETHRVTEKGFERVYFSKFLPRS